LGHKNIGDFAGAHDGCGMKSPEVGLGDGCEATLTSIVPNCFHFSFPSSKTCGCEYISGEFSCFAIQFLIASVHLVVNDFVSHVRGVQSHRDFDCAN
jgi:hypothetical protein